MAARVEIPIVVLNELSPYNPISGAECTIKKRGTEEKATVYKDSGATNETLSNPLTTDSAGRITGWLNRGAYECTITVPGKVPYSEPFDAASAKDEGVDTAWLAKEAVTGEKVSSAIKDASAATPSLRTLGTASTQAAAGNDARLSDERVPIVNSVTSVKIEDGAVISSKMKPTILGPAEANAEVGLVAAYSSLTNAVIEVTPTVASKLIIFTSVIAQRNTGAGLLQTAISVNGVDHTTGTPTVYIPNTVGATGQATQLYVLSVPAEKQVIQLRAKDGSSGSAAIVALKGGTLIAGLLFAS